MNLDRYKKDLTTLQASGKLMYNAIQHECHAKEFAKAAEASMGDGAADYIQSLPSFKDRYQPWYTEAKALVRQLLPDRLSDFTRFYERPNSRRKITYENYTIEDYLHGLVVRDGVTELVGPYAAIPRFRQQLSIVESIQERFRSSLFDIRQMAQADLFDSELDAARELAKNKFYRAAGAVAGVVLERHLKEVCANHKVIIRKNRPQLSDLYEELKKAAVIDTPQWRYIQHLGDIRNLCSHDRETDPTADQVGELLDGVAKVTKTIF